MRRALSLFAVTLALAGCAAPATTGDAAADKHYRTGSHIPDRAPSSDVNSVSKDELDRGLNSSMNPGPSMPAKRPGSS